ncbi:hypothetical protein LE98_004388 [Salmonella enterica subsp. enterica]|nr:hypothetical protein [Salmonella enterica subsp. enterica]
MMTKVTSKYPCNLFSQDAALNYNNASWGRAGNGMTVNNVFIAELPFVNEGNSIGNYCGAFFSAPQDAFFIMKQNDSTGGKTTLMSEMINDLLMKNRSKGK